MPNELTLEQFATESKGLFESLTAKIKAVGGDVDGIRQAMEAFKDDQASLKEEVTDLATKSNRPPAAGSEEEKSAQYVKHFADYVRKGVEAPELKTLSTNPDTEGGFLLPQNRATEIITAAGNFAPIRKAAKIITISQGDSYEIPTSGTFSVGRVGEKETRSNTNTGAIGKLVIPTHEYYAQPPVTQKLLDDSAYNVDALVMAEIMKAFDTMVADDYVEGDGVNKATGFTTKVTASVLSGTAATSTLAGMLKLYTKIKAAYRKNASYAMNGTTLAVLLAEATAKTQPLFQPNLTTGDGLSFLGKPILEMPELPDDGASNYPIYFGDFSYYWVVDRQGFRLLRDPYTSKPYVLLYTTWRTGGDLVLAEAFAKQKSNNS